MAESKDKKTQKTPDSFADDLDSMLNLDETVEQNVGLIDDDDAIDRLLMNDVFAEDDNDSAGLNDIDKIIADEVGKDEQFSTTFDEFADDVDDFIPDFQINPKNEQIIQDDAGFAIDKVDADINFDLSDLESVGEIDEFAGDVPARSAAVTESEPVDHDELEDMNEIDEFSDVPELSRRDKADFLLTDFDIAPDDEFEGEKTGDQGVGTGIEAELEQESMSSISDDEFADEEPVFEPVSPVLAESGFAMPEAREEVKRPEIQAISNATDFSPQIEELTAGIAKITKQFNELKKQQSHLTQQLQLKSNQEDLSVCLEDVDTLQTEQKKTKRNIEAIVNKKPVAAYVANGVAVLALIVGTGLGFQGYIAKRQLAELVDYLGKLKEQIGAAPAANIAENEMLTKRLDELASISNDNAKQIVQLSAAVQSDTANSSGGLGKQLEELNNQDMQMGAAIESLQSKIAGLEKGRNVAVEKPAAKKTPVVRENWAVNLVAFKQDWYAKRKAEEFSAKGVPAMVNRTESKGETWYRLVVDGFKSQYEAAAYAARVKKTLNLDSVWVTKIKN